MRMYRKTFRSSYTLGAVKIRDGLFLGDEFSVRDLEFQDVNKITRIINCCGKQISNRNTKLIKFLTLNWVENDKQILFDGELNNLKQIAEFINESDQNGEGLLVHSVKGVNRSACAILAYFMYEYKWSLQRSIEFLTSRRPGLKIQQTFLNQLKHLESLLRDRQNGFIKEDWNLNNNISSSNNNNVLNNYGSNNNNNSNIEEIEVDPEIVLSNTFLNSKTTATSQTIKKKIFNPNLMKKESIKLRWGDHQAGGKLSQYFGIPQRKNFKISTVNFHSSPMKNSTKTMAGAINASAYNFYQNAQTNALKDKQIHEQQENKNNNDDKQNNKSTFIKSIVKGSNRCYDKKSGQIILQDEEDNLQQLKLETVPSLLQSPVQEKEQSNDNISNKPLSPLENNNELNKDEIIQLTQSLSPQKLSRNDQNRRIVDANPMSLSEQFNKPQQQQPQFIKNIFKIQQNQIKNTTLVRDIVNKPLPNNFISNQKNSLSNAFQNREQQQQQQISNNTSSNQQSPLKQMNQINAPLRTSHFIGQEDKDQKEIEIDYNTNPSLSSSPTKLPFSDDSHQISRTFNFKRQNLDKIAQAAAAGVAVGSANTQTNEKEQNQQDKNNINVLASAIPIQSILASNLVGNESQQENTKSQNNQQDQSPLLYQNYIQNSTNSNNKILSSSKVIVLPKNFSEGSMRPNTASNIIMSTSIENKNSNNTNNPEQAEDPKFSTQRINDGQSAGNTFRGDDSNENHHSKFINRARPNSLDQQNRIFKQLNRKQIVNKQQLNNLINNSSSGQQKQNKLNHNNKLNGQNYNSFSINSMNNNFMNTNNNNNNNNNNYNNNNNNIQNNYIKSIQSQQQQQQYKQGIQSYINNTQTVNKLSFSNNNNNINDNENNYAKRKLK